MSDSSRKSIEVSPNFDWINPDWQRLAESVRRFVVPFVGNDARFTFGANSTAEGGVLLRQAFESLEPWAGSLGTAVVDARCWAYSAARSADINAAYQDRWLRVHLSADESDLPALQELISNLKTELGLRERADRRVAADRTRTYIERRYLVEKTAGVQWLQRFVEAFVPADRRRGSFSGDIQSGATLGYGESFADYDRWLASVAADWGSAIRCDLSVHTDTESRRLRWALDRGEFLVRVEFPDPSETQTAIESLENEFALKQMHGSPALEGGQRNYYAPRGADVQWFQDQLLPAIVSRAAGDFYVDLSARLGASGSGALAWQNIDRWREFVVANWDRLTQVRAYLSGPSLRLDLSYDTARERLGIDIRTVTQEARENLVTKLSSELKLEALGDDPWEVRTTAIYAVKKFSNEIYADEVTSILQAVFPDKHALLEARVFEPLQGSGGDEVRLVGSRFATLDALLERLAADQPYMEAHLHIEGPRGKALSMRLRERRSRLEVRSSERPGDFIGLFRPLEKRLGLTVVSVTRDEASKPSLSQSAWVLIGLPVFTAIATGTLFSDSFRSWVTPKAKIEIVSPTSSPSPDTVQIRWQLQTERFGQRNIDESSPASLRIVRGATEVQSHRCRRSGLDVKLPPGKYTLYVNDCDYGESAKTEFEVTIPPK